MEQVETENHHITHKDNESIDTASADGSEHIAHKDNGFVDIASVDGSESESEEATGVMEGSCNNVPNTPTSNIVTETQQNEVVWAVVLSKS